MTTAVVKFNPCLTGVSGPDIIDQGVAFNAPFLPRANSQTKDSSGTRESTFEKSQQDDLKSHFLKIMHEVKVRPKIKMSFVGFWF